MADRDTTSAAPCGKPAYEPADLSIRADHSAGQVVVELIDPVGDGFMLRVEPGPALELALRIVATVAKLRRIES
jgi:hypothetical protein